MKIMVAYDGTLQAKEALIYGLEQAKTKGGELVALHVFNNELIMDYDATTGAREAVRREADGHIAEAKNIIAEKGSGVIAHLYSVEGNLEKVAVSFAKENKVDVLLCPPKFKAIIRKYQKSLPAFELASETSKMNVAAFATTKL